MTKIIDQQDDAVRALDNKLKVVMIPIDLGEEVCGNTVLSEARTLFALYDTRDVSEEDARWYVGVKVFGEELREEDYKKLNELTPMIAIMEQSQWDNVFRSVAEFKDEAHRLLGTMKSK